MARELGLTPAYLCEIFRGKKPMSYRLAYKWSKTFGKNMDWFLNATPGQIKKFLKKKFMEDAI